MKRFKNLAKCLGLLVFTIPAAIGFALLMFGAGIVAGVQESWDYASGHTD